VNTNLLFANPFPEGAAVAIYNQSAQLVRAADLAVVPPSEVRARPCSGKPARAGPARAQAVRRAAPRRCPGLRGAPRVMRTAARRGKALADRPGRLRPRAPGSSSVLATRRAFVPSARAAAQPWQVVSGHAALRAKQGSAAATDLGARARQVYLHHFVTMDTLIVPPPTGQGIIARQAFEEPNALVVPADRLTPPSKRSAPAA